MLLDTCAAIWLMEGARISPAARAAIGAALAAGAGVHVSPITAWEIANLAARGRLRLTVAPESWFAALLALPGMRLAPMPPQVLIASATLPGAPPRDPADRIIAATSRTYGYVVITRDGALIPYAAEKYMEAVAC